MNEAPASELLTAWLAKIDTRAERVSRLTTPAELMRTSRRLLDLVVDAIDAPEAFGAETLVRMRPVLDPMCADFAERGLSPSEIATYLFSVKEVLFERYQAELTGDELLRRSWRAGSLVDMLGLYTFEAYTAARDRIITSQALSLTELSTPVIKVWDRVLALPLVGTIDSMRARDITDRLLDAVVAHEAAVVILDITGVPVVDTQVANRLMRTVEAVRLLGTRSIVTGINPVIAQTLVQLGVDLSRLTTVGTLHAGLALAFRELRLRVVKAA